MRALGSFTTVIAMTSALAAGCGTRDASDAFARVGRAAAPIVEGVADDGANDDVVLIETDLGDGTASACTGTLVAHKVVVTARHCVSQITSGTYDVGADHAPSSMYFWLGASPSASPDAIGAKILHDGATNLVNHDLAVVVLDRRIGKQLSPLRLANAPTAGEAVKVVGYGLTENDTAPLAALHARYKREGLSVLELGPGTFFTPTTYDLAASELSLGESICEGDSGGPLKDAASDALLAVTSRGGNGAAATPYPFSGCLGARTVNTFTRVDAFAKLITDAITSVGEQPWLEGAPQPAAPPGAPLGGACVGSGDCASGTQCVTQAGARTCSQSCRTDACPSGFQCTNGLCFTIAPPAGDAGADATDAAPMPAATGGGCALASAARDAAPRSLASAAALLGLALVAAARRRRR